jgi:OmcA/MtrC family decaheme c-type cytochrome
MNSKYLNVVMSLAFAGSASMVALAGCTSDSDPGSINSAVTTEELKVRVVGSGTGQVTWTGWGVGRTCTGATPCFEAIPHGDVIVLTATPTGTSTFAGWGGACSGAALTCSVTLNGSTNVIAAFTSSGNMPLAIATVGLGTVTSDVGGISCGSAGGSCATEYAPATVVNLTATADSGQTFQGWAGACTGTLSTCTVTMSAVTNVTALFTGTKLRMDIALTGAGAGNVVSTPAGIKCGVAPGTCGAPFVPGTVVSLLATPKDANSIFSGWMGACQGMTNPCTVTLDDNKSAAASFTKKLLGNALVVVVAESAGANCAAGGAKVTAGMDSNGNGLLDDPAEVAWTKYACNTTPAQIATTAEAVGGANCVSGGWKVTSSIDPSFIYYVCNTPGMPSATPGLNATITSVTPSGTSPIAVRFKLKDDLGNAIAIGGSYSQNVTMTPRFSLSYYTTDGSGNASPLTVYTKTAKTSAPTVFSPGTYNPATNAKLGTLTENGLNAGDYTYLFPAADGTYGTTVVKGVQYDPAHLTDPHVVWIEVTRQTDLVQTTSGSTFYPVNQSSYFTPATGAAATAREIVKATNCYKCHDTKFKLESTTAAAFHGGSRIDPTYCNVCHNPARTSNPAADSKNHIHRIHGAEGLQPVNIFDSTGAYAFPQTTANCAACHGGAAQGAQAQGVPTRMACASCHDYVKFDGTASASCAGATTSATGYTTGVALSIAASTGAAIPYASVITRPSGSFLTDGYSVGQAVSLSGTVSNNVHMTITALSVDGLTMTLSTATKTVLETTPATAYINAYSIPVLCNHLGGTITFAVGDEYNSAKCTSCHTPAEVTTKHQPVAAPDPAATWNGGTNANTNAAWLAASGQVPVGASQFTYDLQSVSTYVDAGGKTRPQATFRILKDGVRADFQTYSAGVTTELYAGFQASPSAYFAWAMPQDGVLAPTEFNASTSCYIRTAWNGSAPTTCTLTGPDSNGYYTVKMTGSTPLAAGATMLTGGIGYTYSLSSAPPLAQLNLAAYPASTCAVPPTGALAGMKCGGLVVPVADVWAVATGYTGRRAIVDNNTCKNCHGALGIEPTFHAGQRNNAPTCSFCHTANRTSSGWAAGSRYFIHAIHGGRVRSTPFVWHAPTPGPGYGEVEYPSPLNDCQTCHLPGTNKLVNANSNLPMTVATGTLAASFTNSPYITVGTNYGAGYAVSGTTGVQTEAVGTTLVISPIATVCSACHDTANALAHMKGTGGARFYEARSTYLADVAGGTSEKCMNCHDQLNH